MATQKPLATKIGHGLAKVLRIDLKYRNPTGQEALSRGESTYSVGSADTYVEQEPTSWEWISELIPTGRQVGLYFYHLFPFVHWIDRYNLQWLAGDLVAGKLSTLQVEGKCSVHADY